MMIPPGTLFPLLLLSSRPFPQDPDAMYDRPASRLHPWRLRGGSYSPASLGTPPTSRQRWTSHHPPSFLSRDDAVPASSAPCCFSAPNPFLATPTANTPHLRPPPDPFRHDKTQRHAADF
ncbi:hypothetical protein GWK47_026343 [Chionoecetes opilio]|uniref:Uncharacterized protein n=1 Tax=Chionoecetes opilio TaxID=41210 RepID=A0A8J8WDR0_CHIOP|nr:hypothetical protein GWK47_026343 [Chionoecetes opilio]